MKTNPLKVGIISENSAGVGTVSRQLFSPLFPHWPADEVPVGHVTNGVHHPTLDSAADDELWTRACGKDRWLGMKENLEQQGIRSVPDEYIWRLRTTSTECPVDYARERRPATRAFT